MLEVAVRIQEKNRAFVKKKLDASGLNETKLRRKGYMNEERERERERWYWYY